MDGFALPAGGVIVTAAVEAAFKPDQLPYGSLE